MKPESNIAGYFTSLAIQGEIAMQEIKTTHSISTEALYYSDLIQRMYSLYKSSDPVDAANYIELHHKDFTTSTTISLQRLNEATQAMSKIAYNFAQRN